MSGQRHHQTNTRRWGFSRIYTLLLVVITLTIVTGDPPDIRFDSQCLYTHYGTAYVGNIAVTKTGKSCQRWDSQTPHAHTHTSTDEFPDDSLTDAANFCRNPNGIRALGVWCYTSDPATEWEYCDVPYCECKIHRSGHGYLGSHSTTYSGVTCQRWDKQTPHAHSYTDEDFPDHNISEANNYCRNPDPNWFWGTFCLTSSPNIRFQHCSISFCECKTTETGDKYEGYQNKTINGRDCQSWSEQTPHEHTYTDISMFPDTRMAAAGSHCRNPDNSASGGPWCFTTDPDVRWEYCDIPKCEYLEPHAAFDKTTTEPPSTTPYTGSTPSEAVVEEVQAEVIQACKFTRPGSTYRGVVSLTVSGRTCQAWTSQEPHAHLAVSPNRLPDATVEDASNHCRNPNMAPLGPWCYTTSPGVRLEYCEIPLCDCKTSRSAPGYIGMRRKTRSGLDCQLWSEQTPHRHGYTDSSFPDSSVAAAENFCRNPDGDDPNGPWCLTTDPVVRWEYCGVPYCECKQDQAGLRYQGQISVTVSRKRCQRWDSQTPHSHSYDQDSMFPEGQIEHAQAFCRNPDDQEPNGPWCYTVDPDTRWEYCDIPLCELGPPQFGTDTDHPPIPSTASPDSTFPGTQNCKLSKTGETFRGSISHTISYRACQRWDSQKPHAHAYTDATAFADSSLEEAGNACRNPNRARPNGPWCYTLDPDVEWEYCSIPECGCKSNRGGWTYTGTMSVTRHGYTCQRWDSQTPHTHSYQSADIFPDDTLEEASNYCRNPDRWEPDGPWCYTTDATKTWDYCDIPFCECTTSKAGYEYGGRISTTTSGLTCQRWDAQTPHRHRYYDPCPFPDGSVTDAANYCRNPEQNELDGVWCYTTDSTKRWDYCDVPMCEDNGKHPLVSLHGGKPSEPMTAALRQLDRTSLGGGTTAAIVVLSLLVIVLAVVLAIILYPRREELLTGCLDCVSRAHTAAAATAAAATKAFENPLYGDAASVAAARSTAGASPSPASVSAAFNSSSSVHLEVPDPFPEQSASQEGGELPQKNGSK